MEFQGLTLPAGLHVRPSTTSDQTFLNTLYKSTRADLNWVDGEDDFIEYLKESQQDAQLISYEDQFPNAMFFIIEYHQERAGRIILDFDANEIRVVDISLIPQARGKGLGTAVMRSFVHCAEQTKIPLKLCVLTGNLAAKHVYSKLGFIVEEQLPPRDFMAYYPSTQGIRVGI